MIQQGGRLENVPKRTKYGFTFQRKFPRDKLRSASWRILMYLSVMQKPSLLDDNDGRFAAVTVLGTSVKHSKCSYSDETRLFG